MERGRHGLHVLGEESSEENIVPLLERCTGRSRGGEEMNKEGEIHGSRFSLSCGERVHSGHYYESYYTGSQQTSYMDHVLLGGSNGVSP